MSTVILRRCLYACAAVSGAVVLLLAAGPAHPHNQQNSFPHANSVKSNVPVADETIDNHITVWRCNDKSKCERNGDSIPVDKWKRDDEGNLNRLEIKCRVQGNTCGHSKDKLRLTPKANWSYVGHRNRFTTTWGCPTGSSLAPSDRWGLLADKHYRLLDPPADPPIEAGTTNREKYHRWPHCRPGLTVSNASAAEGNKLTFKIKLTGTSGRVSWSTGDGTAKAGTHYTAVNSSKNLHSGNNRTVEVEVVTADDSLTSDKKFTLTASYSTLSASGTGTITNVDPEPEEPTPTPTPPPAPTLTVSSPSVTEGDNLVFTISLENTTGSVSWYTRDGTATGSGSSKDFHHLGADVQPVRLPKSGGGRTHSVSVRTVKDNRVEGSETMKLSVSGPGGLRAEAEGRISDGQPEDDEEEEGWSDEGGWYGKGYCDAGITVAAGGRLSSKLPVYDPPESSDLPARNVRWAIRRQGSNTWYGKSPWYTTPRKWKTAGLPPGSNVSYDGNIDMDLYGTVPRSVYETRWVRSRPVRKHWTTAGTYRIEIQWKWSGGTPARRVQTTTCRIKVVNPPPKPLCPAVSQFRRGVYRAVQLLRVSSGDDLTASSAPRGMSVVEDSNRWWLRGTPTRLGTYSMTLTKSYLGWHGSVRCPITVHNRTPITVTAVDTSFTEGDSNPDVMINPNWRGWASVRLSRQPARGEGAVVVTVRVRNQRSGSQRNTADRFNPPKPTEADFRQWLTETGHSRLFGVEGGGVG